MADQRVRTTRVLGIPCPWDGDDRNPPGLAYMAWFALYRRVRVIEHWIGRHQWRQPPIGRRRCDWCGKFAEAEHA